MIGLHPDSLHSAARSENLPLFLSCAASIPPSHGMVSSMSTVLAVAHQELRVVVSLNTPFFSRNKGSLWSSLQAVLSLPSLSDKVNLIPLKMCETSLLSASLSPTPGHLGVTLLILLSLMWFLVEMMHKMVQTQQK